MSLKIPDSLPGKLRNPKAIEKTPDIIETLDDISTKLETLAEKAENVDLEEIALYLHYASKAILYEDASVTRLMLVMFSRYIDLYEKIEGAKQRRIQNSKKSVIIN